MLPNAIAFMRSFEIVCEYLEIRATIQLFFYCFKIQRQTVAGKHSWVSLENQEKRLFKMFMDSVRNFKDRYYLVRPDTERASLPHWSRRSWWTRVVMCSVMMMGSFELNWSCCFPFTGARIILRRGHNPTLSRIRTLTRRIKNLTWLFVNLLMASSPPNGWRGIEITDENGEPIWEVRAINTKPFAKRKWNS